MIFGDNLSYFLLKTTPATTNGWRDVALVGIPVLGGLIGVLITAVVAVKNVKGQIKSAETNVLEQIDASHDAARREHRLQQVTDQRAAFVAYLVASNDLAHALLSGADPDAVTEASRALDRTGAAIELFDIPPDLDQRMDLLSQTWSPIVVASMQGQPPAAVVAAFGQNADKLDHAQRSVRQAMLAALKATSDPDATNPPQ
jgi:hypothetical protein